MKKFLLLSVLVVSSLGLSACSLLPSVSQDQSSVGELEQKNEIFEQTGVISQTPSGFSLTTGAGEIISIESYSLDFSEYVGDTVTVSGEYSGDTFFVTQIE